MGSAKSVKIIEMPEPHMFGRGRWTVEGTFSVADLKGLIPHEIRIPGKNYMLAMVAGKALEDAANNGIPSTYIGMVDSRNRIVSVDDLIARGEKSDKIEFMLANVPKSDSEEDVRAYHEAIMNGEITVYVADVESIFRAGLPLGSSVFKKICEIANLKKEYGAATTYDETAAVLYKVKMDDRIHAYLKTLGVFPVPMPGAMLPKPVYNYTTKFSKGGDEDIEPAEAARRLGGLEKFSDWRQTLSKSAAHQIRFCRERDVENMDGKLENVEEMMADLICNPDENRLMIRYTRDNVVYLIPTNKEIQRAIFRKEGVYEAIEQAKAKYGKDWQEHLFNYISREKLADAAEKSAAVMANALGLIGNRLLKADIFDAKPIESWVNEFLPYASRVQKG